MKVVDAGHEYLLDSYDGGDPVLLTFVKREGGGYPFNVGHYPGTNCQEAIRALIDRVKYLQKQIPCDENRFVIDYLRRALWQFEIRAARRHGRSLEFEQPEIELVPTCAGCGHIGCDGGHKATTPPAPVAEAEERPRKIFDAGFSDADAEKEAQKIANRIALECVQRYLPDESPYVGRGRRCEESLTSQITAALRSSSNYAAGVNAAIDIVRHYKSRPHRNYVVGDESENTCNSILSDLESLLNPDGKDASQ